jgi:Predicted phosphohydrolases
MELLFVHLSDLHIKSNSQIDYNKAELIGRVVDGLGSNCKAVFFLISGDIAFSGAQKEYELAELFLKKIFEVINIKKIVITCAGNHDCDFNLNDNIRELVISELKKTNEVKSEYIEKVTTVFESYLKFSSKLCDAEVCNNISTIFNDQNLKVIIKTLNSSWMSHKEEMPGNAFFPIEELEVKKVRDQLSILIMHHPANWFIPEQQRDIRRLISSYNFVFTGHEHENGSYKIDDVPMIEGGELTPVKNNYNSSFNVVKYNTEMHSYKLLKYNFCKKSSVYVADNDPDWVQIGTGCLDPTLKFHLIAQFKDNLQDAGAPYRHPKKPTLTIDELFIYPDVQSSGRLRKKDNSSDLFLSLEKIFNDSLSGRYYIVGGERSGKSTICRKLFLDKFYCDNVPFADPWS